MTVVITHFKNKFVWIFQQIHRAHEILAFPEKDESPWVFVSKFDIGLDICIIFLNDWIASQKPTVR